MEWRNAPEFSRDNEIVGEKKFRQSETCRIRELEQENARLRDELDQWRPLTPEEAQKAYDEAEAVPMSEEEIERIVQAALDPAHACTNSEQAQMAAKISDLKAQLAADSGILQGAQDRAADLQRQLPVTR